MMYAGTGESQRTIALDFRPRFVVVYKRNVPFVAYSNGVNAVNAAAASYSHGSTAGISLTSNGVSVIESEASNGVKVNLNENNAQYTLIAFK